MNNRTRAIFKDLFEADLRLLTNPVCENCDARIKHPLLPWIVGHKFNDSTERILVVGKPHRGVLGDMLPSGIMDPTDEISELWEKNWPYWSYTREIVENLYGINAREYIAFTNVVKCTNVGDGAGKTKSVDLTSKQMAHNCIEDLGVIWKEIECLKPLTIIFYTYSLFREMLQGIPLALEGTIQEITSKNHAIQCRNKKLGWWERRCETPWTNNLRVLVVGHPERMARQEYTELLTNWIRPNA